MNRNDQKELMIREFSALGFNLIHWNEKPSANGVDFWVQKNKRAPLSVEMKKVRKKKNGVFQVAPVSPCRTGDNLVAIIVNSEYVLIEPMEDHLRSCGKKGYRQFTLLCGGS